MSNITVSFYDYSHVKITAQQSTFKELREHFSFYADGYQFSPKYIYGQWDGQIKLLEPSGLLPFGLVNEVVKFAKNNFFDIKIDPSVNHKNDLSRDDFDVWINSKKYYSNRTEIFPYWYQLDAVYQSLIGKRRILNLPTSAGKSMIQALLTKFTLEHSDQNVLILVPTVSLVEQMRDDFVDYGLFKYDEIAQVRSGYDQKKERIVVSTWQSAVKKPKKWFEQFGMFLCDEMHLATGTSISNIIKKMTLCEYKIGLSGSLRDGKANLMNYVGLFGTIYSPVKTHELMASGQISKLKINALFLKYPEKVSNAVAKVDYAKEIDFITSLGPRNRWIANLSYKLSSKNENVFVMFRHREHGKKIYELLKEKGHENVYYVSGEIDSETRTKFKKIAENNSGVIIIASYGVFSTGISVKNLHHVVLAHPVKSKITVLQTIGRVLRKHESKSIATIWDIIDDMSIVVEKGSRKMRKNENYALQHGIERIERYAVEQFEYNIRDVNFL